MKHKEEQNKGHKEPRQRLFSWVKLIRNASFVILALAALSIWFSPFNYVYGNIKAVICSDADSVKAALQKTSIVKDSAIADTAQINMKFLEEMRRNGQLLSSDEFASRITSYYDILVGVMGAMFILFSLATYFSIKQSFENKFDDKQKEIEEKLKEDIKKELKEMLRDSRQVRDDIVNTITGELEDHFITPDDIEATNSAIKELTNKQKDLIAEVAELQELVANKEYVVKDSTGKRKTKSSKTSKEA